MEKIKKINKELEKLGIGEEDNYKEIMEGFLIDFRKKIVDMFNKFTYSIYKAGVSEDLISEVELQEQLNEIIKEELDKYKNVLLTQEQRNKDKNLNK